jgi:glyoxylase-like metal-dependent hydrolase (beta-lactamase superfamily II)
MPFDRQMPPEPNSHILETYPVGILRCNCTLLGDTATGEAMIVDPGDDIPLLLARLEAHKLRLTQIVITHAHIDHVGGAAALKRATGAPILLHQADLPLLAMMEHQADWLGVAVPQVAAPDASAEDGIRIGLASRPAEVIHTPGHTEGSICLHFAAEKLLIAGDTLFAGAIGRTDLPGGNERKILRSLRERLLPLPDETRVIPGHGRETSIGAERVLNPFLRTQ